MGTTKRYLTKSRYRLALTCPTKLFYTKKRSRYPDNKQTDAFMAVLAEQGIQVGALAQQYFPGGHLVETLDEQQALDQTQQLLLKDEVVIFEAAFAHDHLFVRVDILVKKGALLELIEVKAKAFDNAEPMANKNGTFSSKWRTALHDVAFQKHVLMKALPDCDIHAFLMLTDKQARAPIDGLAQRFRLHDNPHGQRSAQPSVALRATEREPKLLVQVAVDAFVAQIFDETVRSTHPARSFDEQIAFLASHYQRDEKIPATLGTDCRKCEFRIADDALQQGQSSGFGECWAPLLKEGTPSSQPLVIDLGGSKKSVDALVACGDVDLRELNPAAIGGRSTFQGKLKPLDRQSLQVLAASGQQTGPFLQADLMRKEMDSWNFPLHFIDFETSTPALPFHKGRKPYEVIAFQFSHHTVTADGTITHANQFLQTSPGQFPNFAFVEQLRQALAHDDGTIFRYASHENTVLNHIAHQISADLAGDEQKTLLEFIHSFVTPMKGEPHLWYPKRGFVDLHKLVKQLYFDPTMGKLTSLKVVLPAIVGSSEFLQNKYSQAVYGGQGIPSHNFKQAHTWLQSDGEGVKNPYKTLEPIARLGESDTLVDIEPTNIIADGGAAMAAYATLQSNQLSPAKRAAIEQALLRYCELDTLAMVMLYEGWRAML